MLFSKKLALQNRLRMTVVERNFSGSVYLNGNQLLEGFLPESLSNCNYLQVLDLWNNQIKDVFPHRLQTLPELKVLVLRANNKLYGPIAGLKTKHVDSPV